MPKLQGLSTIIREVARERYVTPAIQAGERTFSIPVRGLMEEIRRRGISPAGRTPAFCTSIQTDSFLTRDGLEIEKVDGPRSKLSTTVVVHYRRIGEAGATSAGSTGVETEDERMERMMRLVDSLSGLMRDEIEARGGVEGYLRWVRSDEDEDEGAK